MTQVIISISMYPTNRSYLNVDIYYGSVTKKNSFKPPVVIPIFLIPKVYVKTDLNK